MDPQVTQQLTQLVQQMLQVLQSAGGGAPPMDDGGMDDDMTPPPDAAPMDKDMMSGGAAPMMDDDDDDDMGGDMMGGASLHDRVQRLESHTGLKKSAQSTPISDRVDALERHWLGEEYDGPMVARVQQLEKAAGVLNKSATTAPRQSTPKPEPEDEAPDVIPLDSLIKAAIAEGVKAAVQQTPQPAPKTEPEDDDLPSISEMRKAAGRVSYGQRKRQRNTVETDAQLQKTAEEWGYSDSDLDKPVGFADLLMAQYVGLKNGSPILIGGDDD